MKILVINGSPRGNNGNTAHLLQSFLEGIKGSCNDVEVREVIVSDKEIAPCKGCFSCWINDRGRCCMEDDMTQVIQDQLWADTIIWSFPLYYYNLPGHMKTLVDRQLPMLRPLMVDDGAAVGSGFHPHRYDMSGKRHVLISTCGFYSAEGNYDSIEGLFNHMLGADNYEKIFCGQGALFSIPQLAFATDKYLESVKKAGAEFVNGHIAEDTQKELSQLLFPREKYEKMCNSSWGIE